MPLCFVIQPFDRGKFDERFEDVFRPAIEAAGFEAYRVDQDPSVSIPIEEIEKNIQDSDVCLVDITTDNPNVWFEFGYAISCGKEICIVCSEERETKYPFDVQHRSIIRYGFQSPRHFEKLRSDIERRLSSLSKKLLNMKSLPRPSPLVPESGLSEYERAIISIIAENIHHTYDAVLTAQIRRDMNKIGYTPVAVTMALEKLVRKSYIEYKTFQDESYNEYGGYSFKEAGVNWLLENERFFQLKKGRSNDGEINSFADEDIDLSDLPF